MERARYLQSVCVLLTGNGEYHLERHTLEKVRVFEGALNADELRNVVHILSSDVLFNLKQNAIPDLMLKADDDHVMVTIHRPNFWQELSFPDSASRQPFREAMDPLMKWFEAINKRKMRELSEEAGRNNCLPPSKAEFAQRKEVHPKPSAGDSSPPPPSVAAPRPTYAMQMIDRRLVKNQTQVSCLVVSASGAYHLVKQTKDYNRGLSSATLDGTLSSLALASLHAVLDAPDLVKQPEVTDEGEMVFYATGSYFTRLNIPRDGKVQKVAAWKSYRIVNHVLTNTVDDQGTALLAPLREWLKNNIPDQSAVPTANPQNPRCSPEG
jgi:hypothetical protein